MQTHTLAPVVTPDLDTGLMALHIAGNYALPVAPSEQQRGEQNKTLHGTRHHPCPNGQPSQRTTR
jgi:hypothetical protein